MVDPSGSNRELPSRPMLSPAQRAFLEAAEGLGATAPDAARLLTELPRLSSRELDNLVELGLVREATDWRYYVFRSRREVGGHAVGPEAVGRGLPQWARGRGWRTFLFWLLVILIPILLMQVAAGG